VARERRGEAVRLTAARLIPVNNQLESVADENDPGRRTVQQSVQLLAGEVRAIGGAHGTAARQDIVGADQMRRQGRGHRRSQKMMRVAICRRRHWPQPNRRTVNRRSADYDTAQVSNGQS